MPALVVLEGALRANPCLLVHPLVVVVGAVALAVVAHATSNSYDGNACHNDTDNGASSEAAIGAGTAWMNATSGASPPKCGKRCERRRFGKGAKGGEPLEADGRAAEEPSQAAQGTGTAGAVRVAVAMSAHVRHGGLRSLRGASSKRAR